MGYMEFVEKAVKGELEKADGEISLWDFGNMYYNFYKKKYKNPIETANKLFEKCYSYNVSTVSSVYVNLWDYNEKESIIKIEFSLVEYSHSRQNYYHPHVYAYIKLGEKNEINDVSIELVDKNTAFLVTEENFLKFFVRYVDRYAEAIMRFLPYRTNKKIKFINSGVEININTNDYFKIVFQDGNFGNNISSTFFSPDNMQKVVNSYSLYKLVNDSGEKIFKNIYINPHDIFPEDKWENIVEETFKDKAYIRKNFKEFLAYKAKTFWNIIVEALENEE